MLAANLLKNSENIVENTGHIGLVISKISREKIWPKMGNWIYGLF